jgi:micrococcal nuclease
MEKNTLRKIKQWILGSIAVIGAILGILTLTGTHESLRRFLAGLLIILTAVFGAVNIIDSNLDSGTTADSSRETVVVERIIDGDTIVVDERTEVRLIGVDTPESGECYYQEAKEALAGLIEGKEVRLEKDVSGIDDFGRLLRYVFVPSESPYQDDIFVNDYLLKKGYADVLPLSQDRTYRRILTSSRNQAITAHAGMWGACENREEEAQSFYPLEANDSPTDPDCVIKGNISDNGLGKTYFPPGCSNYEKVKIDFSKGEQYFCTEKEAIGAGFIKSGSCR